MDDQFECQDYLQFRTRLAGDPSEDLSTILTGLRPEARAHTRAEWANRTTTREFLTVGLHLLYRRHFHTAPDETVDPTVVLFPRLSPEDLVRHAGTVILDRSRADELTKTLWSFTWARQNNFMKDLIAFLFRPGPYVMRIRRCQDAMLDMIESGMPLDTFIRKGVELEISANLTDPLVALQAFVETALPNNPTIRDHARRLDELIIDLWARQYQQVFPAFGMQLRAGRNWHDLARTLTVVAHGLLIRARVALADDLDRVSNGDDVLAAALLDLLPAYFESKDERR
jgi:hypothetical protein